MKELVIQLPDNYIDNIYTITNVTIRKAIINAQLLPEHGDLIDRNKLLKQPLDDANYPSNYVRIAPVIIPATKEEKNCDTCQFDGMCPSNVRLLVKHNGCTTWTPKQNTTEEGDGK